MKIKHEEGTIWIDRTEPVWIAANDMSNAVVSKFDLLEERIRQLESKKKKKKIYIKQIEW